MCTTQSRMVGVSINELPKFLAEDPYKKAHAIIVNDPLKPNKPLIIPLVLKGVTSYFPSSNPRESEYEDASIPNIDMTSDETVWEPSDTSFAEQEEAMTYLKGEVIRNATIARGRRIISPLSTSEEYAVDFTDDENLFNVLNAKVNVDRVGALKVIHGVTSGYL